MHKDSYGACGTLQADLLLVSLCTLRYTLIEAFVSIQSLEEEPGGLQVSETKNRMRTLWV